MRPVSPYWTATILRRRVPAKQDCISPPSTENPSRSCCWQRRVWSRSSMLRAVASIAETSSPFASPQAASTAISAAPSARRWGPGRMGGTEGGSVGWLVAWRVALEARELLEEYQVDVARGAVALLAHD